MCLNIALRKLQVHNAFHFYISLSLIQSSHNALLFIFIFSPFLCFIVQFILFKLTHCYFIFLLRKIQKRVLRKTKLLQNWRTLRSCLWGIELLELVQNTWKMQLKLWLRKEKSNEFSYCTTCQHLVSISYAIEHFQREKSRKDPLRKKNLVWDFECC